MFGITETPDRSESHAAVLDELDRLRDLCLRGECERATCPFCPEPTAQEIAVETTDGDEGAIPF